MNDTDIAFIDLIADCINGKKSNIEFNKVDFNQLIRLGAIHKNAGIIYTALKKCDNVPQEYLKVFEQGFYAELIEYSKRTTVCDIITKAFDEKNINHVIIKGKSIAMLYPHEELRHMGDIDFVIDDKDMEQVCMIIKNLGGVFSYERSNEHVQVCKLKNISIEIHSRIAYRENLSGKYDYENYFSDIFKFSQQYDGHTYMLNPLYNVIYTIFHAAKHFYYRGCGVKLITDIAVLCKAYKDVIDMQKLYEQLEIIGLKTFAQKMFSLCNQWFDTNIIVGSQEEDLEEIKDYILAGGVFGHESLDDDVEKIRKIDGKNSFMTKWRWAFPSYKDMREYSQWFKDKPSVFLPIAYIERFCRNAKERGGIVNWAKRMKQSKDKYEKHSEMIKIMGLE